MLRNSEEALVWDLRDSQDAASEELRETEKDVDTDSGHTTPYMKAMSSMYDSYFSVSSPGWNEDKGTPYEGKATDLTDTIMNLGDLNNL